MHTEHYNTESRINEKINLFYNNELVQLFWSPLLVTGGEKELTALDIYLFILVASATIGGCE